MVRHIFQSLAIVIGVAAVVPQAGAAQGHLLYLGGGGEPEGKPGTIFDDGLKEMATFLDGKDWRSDIAFNGGHPESDKIRDARFKKSASVGPFTGAAMTSLIEQYKAKLEKMNPGDQLMVVVDSHGGAKSDPNGLTHEISVGSSVKLNYKNLDGAKEKVTLDALSELSKIAQAKKVKLAIVDLSCYSGNSLSLANDQTCVIASTGPHNYGYSTFANEFMRGLQAGGNLEEIFLKARKVGNGVDQTAYPMISTPVGQKVQSQTYGATNPFLMGLSRESDVPDPIADYLLSKSKQSLVCDGRTEWSALQGQLDDLEKILDNVNNPPELPDLRNLRALSKRYLELRDQFAHALGGQMDLLDRRETISGESAPTPEIGLAASSRRKGKVVKSLATASVKPREKQIVKEDLTWREILAAPADALIQEFTERVAAAGGDTPMGRVWRARTEASLSYWKQIGAKKAEILSQHPELKNYSEKFREMVRSTQEIGDIAEKIGAEEKKIYQATYEKYAKEAPKKNACSDFTL